MIYSSSAENGKTIILTEHLYDRANRIDKQTYRIRNSDGTFDTYVSDYSYRASDGALISVDSVNGNFGGYGFEYDEIARLSARNNYYFCQDYTYRNIDSSRTTTQIEKIDYSKRNAGTNFIPFSLEYTYDNLGNIKTVTGSGIVGQNASYKYDAQSQLTAAVIDGKNYSYEYDTYGNIRTATVNGTNHTYSYDDANWKDLLTAYDNHPITYDEIGNPLSYNNGKDWWAFTWSHGRQLTRAMSENKIVTYTYDMAGIRDSKTVGDVTYHYDTLDGRVVRQTWEDVIPGTNQKKEYVFDIIYDASGLPYACVYEGYRYYYVLNQQGDVIQIIGSGGTVCAEYSYDAWGNILSITGLYAGTLGAVNPIRYRGYYYDTETGFYYLQSRYYDPTIGRFINADQFASTGQGFLGYNMFAYCMNNPVIYIDLTGCSVTTPPMITGGLNLPVGGGIPIVIDGQAYQYAISYNSGGELYEYWFDADGNLIWVRHHSDHRTPWKHKNPHDHQGGKDNNGNNTLVSSPLPVDNKFKTPNDTSQSDEASTFRELAGWALLGYGLYKLGKFALATTFATPTGGLSYVWAAVA